MDEEIIEMFTDGGCSENPGPGGWGVVLRYRGVEKQLSGCEPYTSNNRMELTAAIKGLEQLKRSCRVAITTDSKYLKDGITTWILKWKCNGWKTADKKLVKNIDLWKKLDLLIEGHDVAWHWIKGHDGHRENEIADELAQRAMDDYFDKLMME